jgi:hypothetical protein
MTIKKNCVLSDIFSCYQGLRIYKSDNNKKKREGDKMDGSFLIQIKIKNE